LNLIKKYPKNKQDKIDVLRWEDYYKMDFYCEETTKIVYNEFENNLFNCKKVPLGKSDGVGETIDNQYGVVIITLNMNKKDNKKILHMYWSMPRGTRVIAAYCSLLSKYIIGKTIEEASRIKYEDVADANNIVWPDYMYWATIAPMQSLRAALSSIKKI
jgi:hypothetical protein